MPHSSFTQAVGKFAGAAQNRGKALCKICEKEGRIS